MKLETGKWKLGIKRMFRAHKTPKTAKTRNAKHETPAKKELSQFPVSSFQFRDSGFTLIELMLAMAFLAFMLIFIVLALVQYMAAYNKGLVYKEINQAGRTIFEDLTRSMRVSSVNIRGMEEGRLCVGGQAYVWNTDATNNRYVDSSEEIAGIVRVPDGTGSLCTNDADDLADVPRETQDIIAGPDIAVQSFTGMEADEGGLYNISLKLSTAGANAPISFEGNIQCPPGRDGQHCAVADFTTHISSRK